MSKILFKNAGKELTNVWEAKLDDESFDIMEAIGHEQILYYPASR